MIKTPAEVEARQFCCYSRGNLISLITQSQHLYLVQNNKISVYEYHGISSGQPQLIEQLIHHSPILHCAINKRFICTYSQSLLQIRDRKHWGNVLKSQKVNIDSNFTLILTEKWVYYSKGTEFKSIIERMNLQDGKIQIISVGNFDKQTSIDFYQKNPPLFLQQVGVIRDFYIWCPNKRQVSLGIMYLGGHERRDCFEVGNISLKSGIICRFFHHKINCLKYPHQSEQYVIIIIEYPKQLALAFYQIFNDDQIQNQQPPEQNQQKKDLEANLVRIMNQFKILQQVKPAKSNQSLVGQLMSEAYGQSNLKKGQNFQVQLQGMENYQFSHYDAEKGVLSISSNNLTCRVEITKEEIVENLKRGVGISKLIRQIQYKSKSDKLKAIGIYNDQFLYQESTVSILIDISQGEAEIAQQIEEYEFTDEDIEQTGNNLNKIDNRQIQINNQNSQNRTEQQNHQQNIDKNKNIEENLSQNKIKQQQIQNDSVKEFQVQQIKIPQKRIDIQKIQTKDTNQWGGQTENINFNQVGCQYDGDIGDSKEYLEVQDIVLKYSTTLQRNCLRVKQNMLQREKFDKEIRSIVDNVCSNVIQPIIESQFVQVLEKKCQEIKDNLVQLFYHQLDNLNEHLRKNQAKENSLRGKKIYDFSNQIQNVKSCMSGALEVLKIRQTHSLAFNEIVQEQALKISNQVTQAQNSISNALNRTNAFQKDIQRQISDIKNLINILNESSDYSESASDEDLDSLQSEQDFQIHKNINYDEDNGKKYQYPLYYQNQYKREPFPYHYPYPQMPFPPYYLPHPNYHNYQSAMPQKPRHENTKVAKKALKKDRKDSD